MEKNQQLFCNLESHNYVSKCIPKLVRDNGENITDQFEILEEAKIFYENLYSEKDTTKDFNLENDLNFPNVPKLNAVEANNLEGILTYDELANN